MGADYASADKRLTVSMGVRADGCDYSAEMERFWKQLSPRVSASYALSDSWSVSGSAGLFYQLPPYTALGYKDNTGELVNRGLEYMRVLQSAVGVNWRLRDRLVVSLEGFYKYYTNIPLSVADDVPLTCKGNDYGTSGDELLVSSAQGRAYGLELMVRWQLPDRFNLVGALTVFSSEYRSRHDAKYIPSAWDNRFVANISGTYDFSRGWSVGAKLSAIGGTPYTPYDVEKSSLVEAWNASGRPYYDYSKYNTGRLDAFAQLDVRVDKVFYFRKCMLGIYVDLQNVTFSKLRQPDVLMSTGVIENPSAPPSEQRYKMKYIRQASGTLVPTLGVTVEFNRTAMKNNLLSDKLAYNGDTKTRTHLHLCSYTVDRVEEAAGDDFGEMKSRFQPDGITWLQIHGLEDTDAVQTVCTHFGIDFLVMQDILNTDHASKVEEHDQYNVIIAKQIMGGEAMQVSLVQGADFVLTFQERDNDFFDDVMRAIRNNVLKSVPDSRTTCFGVAQWLDNRLYVGCSGDQRRVGGAGICIAGRYRRPGHRSTDAGAPAGLHAAQADGSAAQGTIFAAISFRFEFVAPGQSALLQRCERSPAQRGAKYRHLP